jgi:RND family efflux transporter MFP subunit
MDNLFSKLTFFIAGLSLIASCGAPADSGTTIPESIGDRKVLLREKQSELQALQAFIESLEDSIAAEDPTYREKPRTLVTTRKVVRQEFTRYISLQGSVEEQEQIMVSSETGGRVLRLLVEEGQQVARGALVAEIDPEAVEKQISELQTSLNLARDVFERQKRLWDQNIGSEIQYLEAKNAKERLEKSLELLELQLGKSKVYAPISGTVDQIMTEAGEMAMPGGPLFTLLDTRRVKVRVDAPENYLTTISKGQEVTVSIPALGRDYIERVSLIGSTIDRGNRTFKVEVEMANPDGVLKPNLLANMKVAELRIEEAVVIPLNLLQQEVGGKKYVLVAGQGEDGTVAKKVYVTTGESAENLIIITKGLSGGEDLIEEGARGLSDRERISIQSTTTSNNG